MASPDAGGGGGGFGGNIATTVLQNMHLGELYQRLTQGPPKIGAARRQEIRAAGVPVNKGQYSLPDIPGTTKNEALYTNTNAKVIAWYRQWVAAGRPALYPKTPDTMPQASGGSVYVPALPNVPPFIRDLPNLIPGYGSVLSRVLAQFIVGGLFWPSSTSSTDTIYGQAIPKPRATPGGRTRGRRGRRALPRPRPVAIPKPRAGTPKILSSRRVYAPAQIIEDIQLGGGIQPPLAIPRTSSSSAPAASSATRSNTSASSGDLSPVVVTAKRVPVPSVAVPSPWPYIRDTILVPLVKDQLLSLAQPRVREPKLQPEPQPAPQPAPNPLTQPYAAAVPYAAYQVGARDCSCAKPKKRRKKGCVNPVTSRTHRTRGGRKFVTVTRRIECQASSRKKLR